MPYGDKSKAYKNGVWICDKCSLACGSFHSYRGHRTSHIEFKRPGRPGPLTEETKSKLRDIVSKKIENGTWHNSFARSRTHVYRGHKLYGTWEVKFAMFLDEKGYKWSRPRESFSYYYDRERHYTPDFYLDDFQTYVEIKGWKTQKDEAKWKYFPYPLIVLSGSDLSKLGIDIQVRKDWK